MRKTKTLQTRHDAVLCLGPGTHSLHVQLSTYTRTCAHVCHCMRLMESGKARSTSEVQVQGKVDPRPITAFWETPAAVMTSPWATLSCLRGGVHVRVR